MDARWPCMQAFSEAGVVASLVNMLGATDVRIQASAAGAISGLVKANTENQVG
jgi:hypothetical protein